MKSCSSNFGLRKKVETYASKTARQASSHFVSMLYPEERKIVSAKEDKLCVVCKQKKGGICKKCGEMRFCMSCQEKDWELSHKWICFKSFL